MTKREVQALAAALAATKPRGIKGSIDPHSSVDCQRLLTWNIGMERWEYDVNAVASVCDRFNRGFNYSRFITDCDNDLED